MARPLRTYMFESEAQTEAFAKSLFQVARIGDVFLLEGDIGAGKTSLARAFIKTACGSETDVPSPTFTLVQTYDFESGEIWHCDLYRLTSPDEAIELGLDAAFQTAITLIEWPDRLADMAPKSALRVAMRSVGDGREAMLFGNEGWEARLDALDG